MQTDQLAFHNVDHLERQPDGGWLLCRFPEEVTRGLGIPGNYNGRFRALRAHGCELRFVTDAPFFDLTLEAQVEDTEVCVYLGDMAHQTFMLPAGCKRQLHVDFPQQYSLICSEALPRRCFSPNVWRVRFGLRGDIVFHGLRTHGFPCRPPRKDEVPAVRWAAYGSSITCGSVSSRYACAYVPHAAMLLQANVWNKGLSGSCLCEEDVGNYLAALPVDVISAEIGVNLMMFQTASEAEPRIRAFLEALQKSAARHVFILDMFSHRAQIMENDRNFQAVRYREYKEMIPRLVSACSDRRFHYLDGLEIAPDQTYLSTDLLHPSDEGHLRMGNVLAERMKRIFDREAEQ